MNYVLVYLRGALRTRKNQERLRLEETTTQLIDVTKMSGINIKDIPLNKASTKRKIVRRIIEASGNKLLIKC